MKNLFKVLLSTILLIGLSNATMQYEIEFKTKALHFAESAIQEMVNTALNIDQNTELYYKARVEVYSKQEGKENYFYVTLYSATSYAAYTFRLDLSNSRVANVVKDYIEEAPVDREACGTCPDPELQVIISYITQFPQGKKAGEAAVAAIKGANIKHVVLIDKQETKAEVLKHLSCPKVVLWGRIGHGSAGGAANMGGGGDFATADCKSNAAVLKGRYFPFNSCYIGGTKNTFGKALVNDAGANYMSAGNDVQVMAGTSEPVWQKFVTTVLVDKKEVLATYDATFAKGPDKWGKYSKTGPLYCFTTNTGVISLLNPNIESIFAINTKTNHVYFTNAIGSLSIFDMSGKLVYSNQNQQPQFSWNLNNINGNQVNTGKYIAVLKSNANSSITKSFSIVK